MSAPPVGNIVEFCPAVQSFGNMLINTVPFSSDVTAYKTIYKES